MSEEMLELVRRAAAGDEEAFAEIYNKSSPRLFRYLMVRVRNEDDAMEISQEIYTNMLEGFRGLQDPASFPGWMKRIVDNTMYKYLTKAYRRREFTDLHSEEDGEETDWESALEDEDLSVQPEACMDRAETNRLVLEMLRTLNEKERTAIVMRYYEDADVSQIAQALGCPEGTVKTYLFRGRGKVEKQVKLLEKQGVKLYSLAPLPFFIWMLRLARAQGTTAAAFGVAGTAAAGAAAGTGAKAAAGAKAAGAGANAGTKAAAGTAAKTAGAAAGKSVATKVVAGALAVSMTAGAGAAVVHQNQVREKEKNREIYQEFIEDYREAFDLRLDFEAFQEDYFRFGEEVIADYRRLYPEREDEQYITIDLDYVRGEELEPGLPAPDTVFQPDMNSSWLWIYKSEGEEYRYSFYDVDQDGEEEMLTASFYKDETSVTTMNVYKVVDGKLYRGDVSLYFMSDEYPWQIYLRSTRNKIMLSTRSSTKDTLYITTGQEIFREDTLYPGIEPEKLEWQLIWKLPEGAKTSF